MQAVIIDYGSGNLRSAAKAFERATRESGADMPIKVSADPADVAAASHIVLPGVGAFADCARGVTGVPGMVDALTRAVQEGKRPFLGICVGMQLLAKRGHEHGTHEGLGWIDGEVYRLAVDGQGLKVPHMGWNELAPRDASHPLLAGISAGAHAYFVHSYHMVLRDPGAALAMTDYGGPMVAVVGCENVAGTQFHPEKSQEAGLRLIANFLRWRP
ncbi:MAG TPA: imidazole glycerol phosphate synthase subunit HisH [Alphaproteobacteria bacterium]|nr:imidazole glycerol phosphate synthase subunit HisH [Alphaproteobacteria bacterium]